MTWKQPIPTGLDDVFQDDWGCNLLYRELIYRSANTDGFFTDKRKKTTPIKRGQVVFGKSIWSLYLQQPKTTINRWLHKLSEKYKKVELQPSHDFTVVTIINYDEIVNMEHQWNTNGTPTEPSKSVKSVNNINTPAPKITPLTEMEMLEFGLKHGYWIEDVKDMQETILNKIATGYKNKQNQEIKNLKLTMLEWLKNEVKWGKIKPAHEYEIMVMKSDYQMFKKSPHVN